jgi:hypothetical protein
MSCRSVHSPKRPRTQESQTPHGRPAAGITRSPSDQPTTPGPSAAIVPDASCPWVMTSGTFGPPKTPSIRLRSEWQIPQYSTLMSTSPEPGSGIGTSSTAHSRVAL